MINAELTRDEALEVYLNDHLAGSSAGVDLFRRVARSHSDPEIRLAVGRLAHEVDEDRNSLLSIMRRLGIRPSLHKVLLGRAGERLGRLKPNGSLLRRTNVTDLVEIEALLLGVRGKQAGWHALSLVAMNDPVLDEDEVAELVARAETQLSELEELRRRVGAQVLRPH
jgi:hypothetical protein